MLGGIFYSRARDFFVFLTPKKEREIVDSRANGKGGFAAQSVLLPLFGLFGPVVGKLEKKRAAPVTLTPEKQGQP